MEKSIELNNYSRKQIMHELLLSVNTKGKPTHEIMGDMKTKYKVSRKKISKVWCNTPEFPTPYTKLKPEVVKEGRKFGCYIWGQVNNNNRTHSQ